MKKITRAALFFGALIAAMAVNAIDLANVSNGAVVLGEWNSNFNACKAKADNEGIPMLLFWSAPGCAKCNKMKTGMNGAVFTAWRKSQNIIFAFSEGSESVKAFARNASGHYPYMRIYWPAGRVDKKFSGRVGEIGGSGSTPEAQLMSRVEAELSNWTGNGSAPQRHSEYTAPVIGPEWSKARRINGSFWKDGKIAGAVFVSTAKVDKKKGMAKVKVQIMGLDGKRKLIGNEKLAVDSTTSGTVSNSNGSMKVNITGNTVSGTLTYGGTTYEVKSTKAGGGLTDGDYKFQLDRGNYPTKCADLSVIDPANTLPFAQKFTIKSGRLQFPRKGTVRYDRGSDKFVVSSTDNPSGLKFTYNRTYGYIKGTLTVYCARGKSTKKYTGKVGGFILGTTGGGEIVIKGVGSYPFTIAK